MIAKRKHTLFGQCLSNYFSYISLLKSKVPFHLLFEQWYVKMLVRIKSFVLIFTISGQWTGILKRKSFYLCFLKERLRNPQTAEEQVFISKTKI